MVRRWAPFVPWSCLYTLDKMNTFPPKEHLLGWERVYFCEFLKLCKIKAEICTLLCFCIESLQPLLGSSELGLALRVLGSGQIGWTACRQANNCLKQCVVLTNSLQLRLSGDYLIMIIFSTTKCTCRMCSLQWHSHVHLLTLVWNTNDTDLDKFPLLWSKTHYDAITLIEST